MNVSVKGVVTFFLLMGLSLIFSGRLQAQQFVFLFGHGVYGSPVDKNFKNNYTTGLGVEGGAAIGWNKTFIVGTIGYTSFSTADGTPGGSLSFVPFKAGIRQYLLSKLIYIHGDLGIASVKNDLFYQKRFSGDIGAGVKLGLFEAQLDYDGFARSDPSGYASWFAIKAGFNIGL